MKIKVSEASGPVLDWMVAKANGASADALESYVDGLRCIGEGDYCTDWSQGGPIIEREKISVNSDYNGAYADGFVAETYSGGIQRAGPTPLIAAMRCYVASRLGEEVEVPDELPHEVYCVECVGDIYQSVFPSAESELSQLHSTVQDALAYFQEVKPGVSVEVPDELHDPAPDDCTALENLAPDDCTALENLAIVGTYIKHADGIPDDVALAMGALYDQIDWIERGIVEWRDVAHKHLKALHTEMAKTRVAISRLQTLLNGQIDANQRLAAETAARDWLESIGEEP